MSVHQDTSTEDQDRADQLKPKRMLSGIKEEIRVLVLFDRKDTSLDHTEEMFLHVTETKDTAMEAQNILFSALISKRQYSY